MTCGLVVMAGGQGTRLRSVMGDVPKALARVGGTPVLGHHIRLAERYGLTGVTVLTGYGGDQIAAYCDTEFRTGITVRCLREVAPLGTAGALLGALPSLGDRFIVSYGDAMMDVALDRLIAHHDASAASATLMLHPNDHPHDSDLVELDQAGRVRAIHGYPHPVDAEYANLVNAALYVFERRALEPFLGAFDGRDITKHLLPAMLAAGHRLAGYVSREYIKDIGTPERLARVDEDHRRGVIAGRNIEHPAPAVFLDRDGTLNAEVNHLAQRDQLELLPGVAEGVRRLNRAGLLTVLITNQPVIARGDCTLEELEAIHARLDRLLGEGRAFLDAKFVCPHHPDRGFPGEREAYKIVCTCRKPAPGLALQAIAALNVATSGSWLIGDTTVDMAVADAIGVPSILVGTGHGGRDGRCPVLPDFECASLLDAALLITEQYPEIERRLEPVAAACTPGAVVAIGGLARSGKSTHAGVLRQMLRQRGQPAHVVCLDGWLRPERDRGNSVRTRYDYVALDDVLRTLLAPRRAAVALQYRRYDRQTRTVVVRDDGTRLVAPDDVVIVEGVPALDLPALAGLDLRCFVAMDDALRRVRFLANYRAHGYSDDAVEALWRAREQDEHPLIVAGRTTASHLLDVSSDFPPGHHDSE
jgi:histidinol-phosphate phosphatase family protein